jgi:hypothetical protein
MDFGQNNIKVLEEFLTMASAQPNAEFEIRFGNFMQNRGENKKTFKPNSDIELWFALKKWATANFPSTVENSTDYIYSIPNSYSKIRKTVKSDGTEYIIKKTSGKQYDIYDYNLRMSIAIEDSYSGVVPSEGSPYIRHKNRISFATNVGKLELTITSDGDASRNPMYEIELEINKNTNLNEVVQFIALLSQHRQKNFYVISEPEKYYVTKKYQDMVKAPFFIGAQPETLQKDQLSLLYKEMYSVTDKADGDRYLMMINEVGSVYFIDNNIKRVLRTDLVVKEFTNCLLDGELIRTNNTIDFHAFDILVVNGNDIRGKMDYLLDTRLKVIKEICNNISNSQYYKMYLKQFIYKNVFLGAEIIMKNVQNKPYTNDGLVFTPMNEPYPIKKQWSKLLKWKPAELNTIDFYSVKEDGIWKLYVQAPEVSTVGRQGKIPQVKTLFDIQKLCNINDTQVPITYNTTFDENLIDPSTGEEYKTNTVIEYSWDFQSSKFVPHRTRWDKTADSSKHGNHSSVACSIWNNIHNPVTSETLFKMTNGSTGSNASDGSFFFEPLKILKSDNNTSTTKLTSDIFESETILKKTLDNLHTNTLVFEYNECKPSYYIDNHHNIVYYTSNINKENNIPRQVEALSSAKVFGKFYKIFTNRQQRKQIKFGKSGSCTIEYITNVEYLKDYLVTKGYTLLDSKKVELDANFVVNQIIFKKTKEETQVLPKIMNKKEYAVDTGATTAVTGISYYKVESLYDIIEIANCKNYTIYNTKYDNVIINQENYKSVLDNINANLVLKQVEIPQLTNTKSHETDDSEPIYQYYIVMYNGDPFESAPVDKVHATIPESVPESTLHREIKNILESPKTTILTMKNYLKQAGLKLSGNKQELKQRLEEYLHF